jgi:hypothetical protein
VLWSQRNRGGLTRLEKGKPVRCFACKGEPGEGEPCPVCQGKGYLMEPCEGEATYLQVLLGCVKGIKDLRGLDAPKKTDVRELQINWDAMRGDDPPEESVEEELARLLAQLPNRPVVTPHGAANPGGF